MNQFDPVYSDECIHIDITDDILSKSKIAAYLYDLEFETPHGKEKPFTPKTFPGKAIKINIPVNDDLNIQIYLDSNEYVWDSKFMYKGTFGKLTADQMSQFFSSEFYSRMIIALLNKWPASDPTYSKLLDGVLNKKLRVGIIPYEEIEEAYKNDAQITEIEHKHDINLPGKRTDLANKDVTGDGQRDYSGSGRKIVHFSDAGVRTSSAEYFCWPRPGKEFKWNSWKDWTKLKPFCKMTFKHNGRKYMISSSLFDEQFENRGFRGGDCMWKPPFAWLTTDECDLVMRLSVVRKFLRQCKKRVKKYLSMTPAEVLKQIDKPERVTEKEIEKTQRVIRHVVDILFNKGLKDNYTYD